MQAPALLSIDPRNGALNSDKVVRSHRSLADLKGIFLDESARAGMAQDRLAYRVECVFPVAEGTPGGLFWGVTFIQPGLVGEEYFMTKGHFHAQGDRAEFYWGIQGLGALICMDRQRKAWVEWMRPGTLHYIPGEVAHRVANVGESELRFGACWPSDAGHDYASIAQDGFSARLLKRGAEARLVPQAQA